LNGIHGLDDRLDHGKLGNPQGIFLGVIEVSGPAVGQNVVFNSSLEGRIGIENVWLNWNVAQVSSDNLSGLAELINVSKFIDVPGGGCWLNHVLSLAEIDVGS